MQIYSKFSDYYDGIQGLGIDPNLVYIRHTEKTSSLKFYRKKESQKIKLFDNKIYNILNERYYVYPSVKKRITIWFCGKVYYIYAFKVNNEYNLPKDPIDTDMVLIHDPHKQKEYLLDILTEPLQNRQSKNKDFYNKVIDREFKRIQNEPDVDFIELHRICNSPIILNTGSDDSNEIILNPKLSDYSFAKHVDPWSAFQELSMFISSYIKTHGNDIIEVSDESKIKSHGYNKWSFRNPNPPKRKQKKNKK